MKKNQTWESLVSILVVISIMSIVFLSLYKILEFNKKIDHDFSAGNDILLLKNNINTLLMKKDISEFSTLESQLESLGTNIFYLYQTGTTISLETDKTYKYINALWEHITDLSLPGKVYLRSCEYLWGPYKCSVEEKK